MVKGIWKFESYDNFRIFARAFALKGRLYIRIEKIVRSLDFFIS